MDIHKISNIPTLLHELDILDNNYIFRGHANADWPLQSSLERTIGGAWSEGRVQQFEDLSLMKFKSKFSIYNRENTKPSSKLSWLSAMQHYGLPTRFLDFTSSPYVALYFAMENYDPYLNKDLSIFALNYEDFLIESIDYIKSRDSKFHYEYNSIHVDQDKIFDDIVDRFSYDIIWITEPEILNVRLDRQAGSFLMSGNRNLKIETALNLDIYKKCRLKKFIISKNLYREIFALLRKMNLDSKSLYGDLDGLARSIKMEMQVYAFSMQVKPSS